MPRSNSQSSNAPGQWPSNSSCAGSSAERASSAVTSGGTSPRTKISSSGLCRSTTSGGSRRSISAVSAWVSGSEPAWAPGEERFVRLTRIRSSGSIPGG